jgi:2-oxoisovalerate dehydrogenase E1 component
MARETSPPKKQSSGAAAKSSRTSSAPSPNASSDTPSLAWIRRAHFLARLSRAWDTRFENEAKAGRIGRWYSAVGNEMTTIGSALCMQPNDALSTVHRDLGAIMATYLDVTRLAPGLFRDDERTDWDRRRADPFEYLYRLACQMIGRRDGFTQGVDRSFHYGILDAQQGIRHVGMISHLGSMLPVGAGLALAALQDGSGATVLGFIGEGATSQGDFHETLNTAGVMKLPYILVIENNQYAFSTPLSEQYACKSLVDRAPGYGIAGEQFDGTDLFAVYGAMSRAFARARSGEGATLIEAMLPRMRGHAEGDGSYDMIPDDEKKRFLAMDPLPRLEKTLRERGLLDNERAASIESLTKELVARAFEQAQGCPEPDEANAMRSMFAPGEVADAFAKEGR